MCVKLLVIKWIYYKFLLLIVCRVVIMQKKSCFVEIFLLIKVMFFLLDAS